MNIAQSPNPLLHGAYGYMRSILGDVLAEEDALAAGLRRTGAYTSLFRIAPRAPRVALQTAMRCSEIVTKIATNFIHTIPSSHSTIS